MEAKNIDDVLIKSMSNQPEPAQQPQEQVTSVERPVESVQEQSSSDSLEASSSDAPMQQTEEPTNLVENDNKSVQSQESPIDEYGNPVEKPKMYSEEEVQNMIRDRLSRGRHVEQQPTQQQVRQDVEGFKQDPNSEEPWDVQLENFIEKTIDKRQTKLAEQQWQQQQAQKQAEFESKFTSGMNKYKDFHQVVSGKPITDSMMLATRTLENPAAFIYGASKLHPQELTRISNINDPYVQAAEIGRLHERMVKERKMTSNAPKPIEAPKGDIVQKNVGNHPSIDERINAYGRQKRK